MTDLRTSSIVTFIGGSRWIFCSAIVLVFTTGCGSNSQRLTQLQNENDRLLSEYRAQRDQVTQLNEKLAVAQNRLAESEKLLARQSPMPASRLSRLNDPSGLTSGAPTFGSHSQGTASNAGPTSKPSNGTNSGTNSDSETSAASDLYWRPMRRETP